MAITVKCPECGELLTAPEEALGKKGRCKQCGAAFRVTAAHESPDDNEIQLQPLSKQDDLAADRRQKARLAASLARQACDLHAANPEKLHKQLAPHAFWEWLFLVPSMNMTPAEQEKELASPQHQLRSDEGTVILMFNAFNHTGAALENHLKLDVYLARRGVFPKLKAYTVRPVGWHRNEGNPSYLVFTGTRDEFKKFAVLYTSSDAQSYLRANFPEGWNSVNPNGGYSTNVPEVTSDGQLFERRFRHDVNSIKCSVILGEAILEQVLPGD